jgi:hypothetical protein
MSTFHTFIPAEPKTQNEHPQKQEVIHSVIYRKIEEFWKRLAEIDAYEADFKRNQSTDTQDSFTRVIRRNTFNNIVNSSNAIKMEMREFQWNIADGKTELEGGATDKDVDEFIKENHITKHEGMTARENFGEWLKEEEIERPPSSCVIS